MGTDNDEDTQELIHKIELEKKLSKQCLVDIERRWKKLLNEEKVESLKQEELPKLRHQCHSQVKQKNEIIQKLLGTLDHTEEQFRVSVASHIQTIDNMIQMHDALLCKMERDFHERLGMYQREFDIEEQEMIEKFESDKKRIIQDTKSIESEEKRRIDDHNREQQQVIEEIKNKSQEDENTLRFALDTKIEDLDEQFEIAKNEYIQKTDTQFETLQKQLDKEKETSKELICLQNHIDKLCTSIKRLKSITRRNSSQNMETTQCLLERKNRVISRYKDTNAKLENVRTCQHEKLKDLTKQANECKSKLKREYDMVQRILKFVHLTKKMEIEQGKDKGAREGQSISTISDNTIDSEGLWIKYNNALIDINTLKEEEEELVRTNVELKKKLQQFEDGVTINDRVMNNHNPLIVVNGKMRPEEAI